jgi:hypothetical protein
MYLLVYTTHIKSVHNLGEALMAHRHRGIIYDWSNPPGDAHYVLTREQFAALRSQLVGLPIRVEHAANTVGRVVSASAEGDRELVEWELNDDAAGWTAAKLTDLNAVRELSLKHVVYGDGRMVPLEVSLCDKGARPGTVIVKASEAQAEYISGAHTTGKTALHDMSAPAENVAIVPPAGTPAGVAPVAAAPAAPAAPQAAAPAVAAQAAVAPAAVGEAAPSNAAANTVAEALTGVKRKRIEDPLEFIKSISGKVTDSEALQSIADFVGEAIEDRVASHQEVQSLREAKALLEKAQEASKDSAKTIVQDVVAVLSDLYSRFAPNVNLTEEQKTEFSNLMEKNPNALNYMRPLVVAASAIHMTQAQSTHVQSASNTALDQAIAKISALQQHLGTAKKMNAHVPVTAQAPVPQWTSAAAAPMAPVAMAPPAAAPMVEVAASGAGGSMSRITLPAILQNLPGFDGANGVGRVTNGMFSRKLPVTQTPLPGPAMGSM